MKKALIIGVSGQDGSFLSQKLLKKGYKVYGTSRDLACNQFLNLKSLGILDDIVLESMSLVDYENVFEVINRIKPDEIYNLAGQTSVSLSFTKPVDAIQSILIGTVNLLEVIKIVNKDIKFYNAGSSECFGDTGINSANEDTLLKPLSPYAIAKSASLWHVNNYRNMYGIFAVTGILFNHESGLRNDNFVTKKIIKSAVDIHLGIKKKLKLGNLNVIRDWGWAPEYVDAMWLMLQQDVPENYVIATGESHSLQEFVETAFSYFGLKWTEHVEFEENLQRPNELMSSYANPTKAHKKLNWSAKVKFKELISILTNEELRGRYKI